jgi:Fic family protein
VAAPDVAAELARFEQILQRVVRRLDELIPPRTALDADQLIAILEVCAWTHAEWVRIHPFANGNGRTARLWANSIALRYGLPPFLRLRPRPAGGYAIASAKAMHGDWQPTVSLFQKLLADFLNNSDRDP